MYDWGKIKDSIFSYCKFAFNETGISILDSEIEEAILIFYNLVNLKFSYAMLASLPIEMLSTLQNVCVNNTGNQTNLRTLSTLLDSFCKKILIVSNLRKYNQIDRKCLRDLLNFTGCCSLHIQINNQNIESYRQSNGEIYIIGTAYLTRNQVHNSPAWDMAEIFRRLRYVLASYILLVHKLKHLLLQNEPNLSKQLVRYFEKNEENALLYDYISYGKSSMFIKNRIIHTYIIHQLSKCGSLTEQELIEKLNIFSDNSLSASATTRRLDVLIKENCIFISKKVPKTYELTTDEYNRIREAENSYNAAWSRFNADVTDLLSRYSLDSHLDDIINITNQLFESQYNYDIEETLSEFSNETHVTSDACLEILNSIVGWGCTQDDAKSLYVGFLNICKDNDILVRINAGKAFRKLSNPDQFNSYVRKAERNIWLDTQILLYLMCYNEDFAPYDHVYYKAALNLMRIPNDGTYHFKVSSYYVRELVYHLRQALLLVSLVDSEFALHFPLSNNVFYRHYYSLHNNDGLPAEIDSFADYLFFHFELEESDVYGSDFYQIAENVIDRIFEEFHIDIVPVTGLEEKIINNSESMFHEAAKEMNMKPKEGHALRNDSCMGVILFDNKDDHKPIFLTYDSMFEAYRKVYSNRYKRGKSFCWHLFSPSKFINHIDFINFKINATNLTDDLISLIEIPSVKDKTISVIDRFNKFLDIPNISSGLRKKYIRWASDLFVSKEFEYTPDSSPEPNSEQLNKFFNTQDSILAHFYEIGSKQLTDFQNMLKNEDQFKLYIKCINSYSKSPDDNIQSLIKSVEQKVFEYISSLETNCTKNS